MGKMVLFLPDVEALPRPADPDRAAAEVERWRDLAERQDDQETRALAKNLVDSPVGLALLEAIFGNSPFLGAILLRDIAFACRLLSDGPDRAWTTIEAELGVALADESDTGRFMRKLRIGRSRAALTAALADISDLWSLEQVTGALSAFADAAIGLCLDHLLRQAAAAGDLTLAHPDAPQRDSGIIVLGMGKLGARELNYSSDIDLIVLYDRARIRTSSPDRLQQNLIRMTRTLIRMLEERTADGFVFRTDLRLRPDPAATPLAMSVLAAETYYESMCQNWERAAMIKARPVAGDLEAGRAFLQILRPFLWRKSLDFWAIQDIHSIKRQINAHRGGSRIAIAGQNVKLGRGGIREIEFFVQTQQLIWGGRQPELRDPATCRALAALVAAGHVKPETGEALTASYRFLRRVEHRLQMIADQQTHTLPADPEGLRAISLFLGYPHADAFADALRHQLEQVERHYARLFEEEPDLGGPGNLVFTGAEDDPDTLATLERLGFRDGARVSEAVRGWHRGRYRATSSVRSRELLTELMPRLLESLAATTDPDFTFRKFDAFLGGLPAGVQLFSLFYSNPELLTLVAEIMGSSPFLGEHMSNHPAVLDAVLSGDFFRPLPELAELKADLDRALEQNVDFESILDITRRWTNDRRFQIGVQMLRGDIGVRDAATALTDTTDATLSAILPAVEAEFSAQHGTVPGGGLVVLGYGKLGSRELTITSDLDLVMVYDYADGADASNGPRPLPAGTYFTRLAQRFIGAVTAPTAEGKLYEVDMRLRPTGENGPIASRLTGFESYYADSAWTWEKMALTRARLVAGPPELVARTRAAIRAILTAARDPDELLVDVARMRGRIAAHHRTESIWAVRHLRGGLVDVEFIAQYLMLRHAHDHPDVLRVAPDTALEHLGAIGLLDRRVADELAEAARFWLRVQGMIRLTGDGPFVEESATPALRNALVRATGTRDFADLKARIATTAERVHRYFIDLVEAPAAALDPEPETGKPD